MNPKDIVIQAAADLLQRHNAGAVERYVLPGYIEHSMTSELGVAGLRQMGQSAGSPPDGVGYELARVIAEDDLVVTHGLYRGLGPDPLVACELWRISDGKLAEHWGARQPFVATNPSGHSMIDGPTDVLEPERTAANKAIVDSFVNLIMMGGDRSQLPTFFDGDRFIQHNPVIADGVSGLGTAIQTGVWAALVERCDRVVAEGEFVFTQGSGVLDGRPAVFFDLFRVGSGKLAEHWDVVVTEEERRS